MTHQSRRHRPGGDAAATARAAVENSGPATVPSARPDGATNAPLPGIPIAVRELLTTLWRNDHAAFVVGGSLRDVLLGRHPADWDLTTDAPPVQIQALFSRALYENRFGTVVVRHRGRPYELTTFRCDVSYSDHRHPDVVAFGTSIEEDLERRDFTVNAMAWGGRAGEEPGLVDPHGGRDDLARRVLRAVGDPDRRFEEDALRMIRAVRLAATLGFAIDVGTVDAIARNAHLVAALSGERILAELQKLLAAPRPSVGLTLMESTGLLAVISPELAAQRGIEQNKIPGDDLWNHTLRTVDAAPDKPLVRMAALIHDIAKPATLADGHFIGHESVGAAMARDFLARLHAPRLLQERVAHLIAQHMFSYEPAWTDAAIRRFIRKVGPASVEDLLALRAADNAGSGLPAGAGNLAELRSRVRTELDRHVALDRGQLAVDGRDLMSELGLVEGPQLGRLLDQLTERVIAEPAVNVRAALIELARDAVSDGVMGDNSN